MKDERNVRHRRTAGGRWRPAAIILAAVLMAVSVPLFGNTAYADPVDLTQDCSLTITSSASTEQDKALLDEANVVVDIYRVGDAIPDEMYDTYHWEPIPVLKGRLELPDDTDRAGWRQVTTQATNLVLGTAPEGQTQWNPDDLQSDQVLKNAIVNTEDDRSLKITGKSLGEKIEGLKPGIYLIIPHGSNITNYCSTNRAAAANENAAADATSELAVTNPASLSPTVMLARSSKRTYQFAPELVALPTKAPNEEGEIKTSNQPYEWIYDASVVLKPAQLGVGGDLEIIKDLSAYEYRKKNNLEGVERDVIDPATFVFEVTAYENQAIYEAQGANAPAIYHNFISIEFTDASSKSALIRDIPVGSYVVVEEVYSGRSYTATVDTTQTATIQPDQPVGVDFTNDYDDRHGGGGSFTNNFKFNGSGWDLERTTDNSTAAEHVSYPAETKDGNK
ncbi:MAG: hypothetical protein E7238_05220 [Sarcina sp.]|nr:hypothetical protein [Sarcina sp.]